MCWFVRYKQTLIFNLRTEEKVMDRAQKRRLFDRVVIELL